MDSKYYTPTIEEFYIGFEYEFQNKDFFPDNEWMPAEIKDGTQIDDIHKSIYNLRCKCLDRTDIESFDFQLDCCVKKEWFYIHEKSNMEDGTIRLTFREKDSSVEINWVKSGIYFYGKIKNKSELRKLMKQLNIKID